MHRILVAVALAVAGCARSAEPPDLTRFFRAGVDVSQEADAVQRTLTGAGYTLAHRIDGPGLVALGFAREDDDATAVRIVTERGIAFGMDGYPEGLRDAVPLHVAWVGEAWAARDWTGDGDAELFLAVRGVQRPHPCVAVLRVSEGGFVVETPLDTGATVGSVCAEEVRPLGDEGPPALHVVERHRALWSDGPPTVTLPLVPRGGRWGPLAEDHAHWEAQREQRRTDGDATGAHLEGLEAVRAAVELAALARLRGQDGDAQVKAFDKHMRGRVLSEAMAAVSDCARGHVLAGWPERTAPCYTPEPHGP